MVRGKKARKKRSFYVAVTVLLTVVFTQLFAISSSAVASDSSSSSNGATVVECENMTLNGQYAGTIGSPFNGVALYANNDSCSYTQYFGSDKHDFKLRGASNNSSKAAVDLKIGGSKVGTFYFSGNSATEYTLSNISHGTGDQTIELVVTTDTGNWDVYVDCLTITSVGSTGSASGSNGSNNSNGANNSSSSSDSSSNNSSSNSSGSASGATVVECENMTLNGQYAGTIGSPFNGVALYANNDSCSYTQYFGSGQHDFKLRGASNNSTKAAVDLKIGGSKVGTFYFNSSSATEYTLSNISHGTGDQTIELVVTTDNGNWDAYVDCLTITSAGSTGGSSGSNNSGSSNNSSSSSGSSSNNSSSNSSGSSNGATVVECEKMTLSGQYAGKTGSPFNGVALYANNDSCSYTQYFGSGQHDFKLRGASNNSTKAAVDLKIGGSKVGTFYFNSSSATEYTLSNISHGTGDQTIELVVTTDNGNWDAYVDCLTITSAGSAGSSSGSGSSNNSGSSSSGGSNSSTTVKIDDGYAMQRVQLMNANNNSFVTAPSSTGNLTAQTSSSKLNQWVFMNNGSNQYMIVNAATGYVLAPQNNSVSSDVYVTATGKNGATAQYWNVSAVSTDCNGDNLTYKITNCANSNLCLQLSGSNFVLGNYSGSSSQKFYINSYGAEGFAGKCVNMSGSTKASVTGGLFGKTVYVSDFNSLSSYCSGSTAYTIVINGNISKSDLSKISVGKNKTIIGSFGANTLNNVHFRCTSNSGNVIFKNITFKHDASKNQNDDIQMYISNGNNFWVDHCTFAGHSTTTSSDVDKLMYVGLKADYVSVTGCVFMGHKYGLILGYPEEDGVGTYSGYPRMTICNNYFYNVLTRAPGLMRYGYFHCYNNFVYGFNLGYTPYTGANIYSEKNYFDKGDYKGAVVDDKGVGGFTDVNSVLSSSVSNLSTGGTSFRPSNNYHYDTRSASDAKAWCQRHTGVQSSSIVYAID